MKPEINQNSQRTRSLNVIIALAVVSLLSGASVSAGIDDLVEPIYAEDNPYAGVVDDSVGDATWDKIEKNEKGLKGKLKSFLSDRVDISNEDREAHLEQRIAANAALSTALQFCIDNLECDANPDILTHMLFSMDARESPMMKEVDIDMSEWEERKVAWESEHIDWEEKKIDWELMNKGDLDVQETPMREDKMHHSERFENSDWNLLEEADLERKMSMVEHASIAILYCITNERCAGLDATNDERHSFVSTLNKIGEEMANRHADYQECYDGSDCERKDMEEVSRKGPRGLMSRIKHSLDEDDSGQEACEANGRTWAENRRECYSEDDYDRKDFQRFEVTQEVCEDREGIWTQAPDRLGEDYYYCDWSIYEFDHPTSDDSDDSKR